MGASIEMAIEILCSGGYQENDYPAKLSDGRK